MTAAIDAGQGAGAGPGRAQPGTPTEVALQTMFLGALLAITFLVLDANIGTGGDSNVALNAQVIVKLALWTIGAALAFAHLRQLLPVLAYPGPLLFAATLALAVFSTSYSPNPALTLGACYGVICTALFTVFTMRAFPERGFSTLLVGTMVTFVLICWPVHYGLPGVSQLEYLNAAGDVSTRLGGLTHPNAVGRTAAIALGIGLLMFRQRQLGGPAVTMLAVISLATLIATQSRTALLGLVIGLLGVLLRKFSLPTLVALVALGAIGGLAVAAVVINDPTIVTALIAKVARSGDVEEIYSLTGRVIVWSFAWEQIQLSPLLGHGFGAARELYAAGYVGPNEWVAPNTHNALLEVLISLGFVGGILVIATLVRQLYLYLSQPRDIPDFILLYTIATGAMIAGPYAGVPSGLYLLFVVSIFWRPCFPRHRTDGAVR